MSRDLAVLRQLLRGMPRGATHAERLQAFYAPQAAGYDAFRDRLLPGRAALIERLVLPDGAHVVELGAGTGRNVEYFGARLRGVARCDLVDLCPALLAQARERMQAWPQVRTIEADATQYRPDAPVDCVYLSYALTMIPAWRETLSNAVAMLKPGGVLGVVDFYVAPAHPAHGAARHGNLTRLFWPRWFAHDGVRLDVEHLPTLRALLPDHEVYEGRARLPYLPGLRAPYYLFVGRKAGPVAPAP